MEAETLIRPVIEGAGLEIVDVTFARESGRRILRVVVDRDGGVDLDTIADVAERVSRRLDLEGFGAGGSYSLELTSPGIVRPLKRPRDFARCVGSIVRVRTVAPVATHQGELVASDEDAVEIASAGERVRVRYAEIASARTVVDWDAELKGSRE